MSGKLSHRLEEGAGAQAGVSSLRRAVFNSAPVNRCLAYASPQSFQRLTGSRVTAEVIELIWQAKVWRGDIALRIADHFVGEGGHVLDIGANWGLFSYHFSKRVGRSGRVYTFEPNPSNWRCLAGAQERYGNVSLFRLALSDHDGLGQLFVPRLHGRSISAQGSLTKPFATETSTVKVRLSRLDHAFGEIERVDFVKIDVEGHERNVLRGGRRILGALPPMLIEIEQRHLEVPIDEVFSDLEQIGYRIFAIRESGAVPLCEFDVHRDQLQHLGGEFDAFSVGPGYVHDFVAIGPSSVLPASVLCSEPSGSVAPGDPVEVKGAKSRSASAHRR